MTSLFDLTGKKAIVTGGTRGLGRGIAEGLMEAGASVTIFGTGESAKTVAEEFCKKGFDCRGIIADIGDRVACKEAYDEAVEAMGGLDILVNCAGVQSRHPSEEFPFEDWDWVINVNLNATFELCQLAGNTFIAQGHGKIINLASMLSFFGGFTVPAYAASKGGVAQLTKALSNEWSGKNIQVNAIAPGYMATDMNTALTDPANPRYKEITDRIPAHRWGTGDDMKGAAIFLASAASDYLNGAVIPVDGGYLVK